MKASKTKNRFKPVFSNQIPIRELSEQKIILTRDSQKEQNIQTELMLLLKRALPAVLQTQNVGLFICVAKRSILITSNRSAGYR